MGLSCGAIADRSPPPRYIRPAHMDALNQDVEVTELAWLFNMNRGIFMTPGREEEWTLSVTHTNEAIDAYIAVFDEMAAELTA